MDSLLALEKSFDRPSTSEVKVKDMGKTDLYKITTNYKRAWTICILFSICKMKPCNRYLNLKFYMTTKTCLTI